MSDDGKRQSPEELKDAILEDYFTNQLASAIRAGKEKGVDWKLSAQSILWASDKIKQLGLDIKFLLSFAPDESPPGLDPTFYHTLTHDGDMELSERIKNIRLRSK